MNGYQLKITIRGSKPPIWRRVIVPDKITFASLDDVIECIFGWTHEHLYNYYFRDMGVNIALEPEAFGDFDAETECVDDWFREGRKILYTYDFGDNWEHDIVVEKYIPYEHRYAKVLKSKGPYMIEDCGGLYGFCDVIKEAQEFDFDVANRRLRQMEFKEAETAQMGDDAELSDCGDEICELEYLLELTEKLEEMQKQEMELTQQAIDENKDLLKEEFLLKEEIAKYKKKTIIRLARVCGFTGYSGFKKKELAEWVANHLLDTVYMTDAMKRMSVTEVELFERALAVPEGIWADREVMTCSPFLTCYGSYNYLRIFRIPADVREKYNKLCTPSLKEERENIWKWGDYVECAIYRYGVIPLSELIKIYFHYTRRKLTEEEAENLFEEIGERECFCRKGNLLIEPELMESGEYQYILENKAKLPYYLPDTEKEFLAWHEAEGQEKEAENKFLDFLLKRCGLEERMASLILTDIKLDIRDGRPLDELMEQLECGLEYFKKDLSAYKQYREAEKLMKKLVFHTRIPQYRGYSPAEAQQMEQMEEDRRNQARNVVATRGNGKIIDFPTDRKIYPNAPCPCGSGKKYKYCCGRNK